MEQDMRTGFAGDWHGNRAWAKAALALLAEHGCQVVYHAGDFGLWPGSDGKHYLVTVSRVLEEHDQMLYVVLGNHEDYDRVKAMRVDENGWLYVKAYPRIRFAPRGHTWVDRGARMAALGGATSIDRRMRTEGRSWWPDEEITDADVDALRASLAREGWDRVDVMVTHDAPAGLHRPGITPAPSWFTPEIAYDAWQGRVRLRDAVDAAGPRWLVHGHWHSFHRDTLDGVRPDGSDYTCEVVGLTADGMARNLLVADLVPGSGLALEAVLPPLIGIAHPSD